jgi:NAD(P)-dependent dehydrogenase (short-subunit alcohol dehydrogenase family)
MNEGRQEEKSRFSGKRALVVGGSGGLGAEVSAELARRGARLVIHGKSKAKVETLCRKIADGGGEAQPLPFNLDTSQDLFEFCRIVSQIEDIQILALAYGPFVQKPLEDHSPEDWVRASVLDLALPGALVSLCLPGMKSRGFGRILLFGGTRTDVIRSFSTNVAYAAAKTGLGVLAKSIAAQGASRNVAAILACPGFVRTEYLSEETIARLKEKSPVGELFHAGGLVSPLLDLLQAEPCAASGAVISLDGGLTF